MRPPNLKTLARQLGLSVTTISRALKVGPEVRPETVARVKAAPLGYRPDPRAVGLRTGRTGVVEVLFWGPHVDDVGDSSITAVVEGVCGRLGPASPPRHGRARQGEPDRRESALRHRLALVRPPPARDRGRAARGAAAARAHTAGPAGGARHGRPTPRGGRTGERRPRVAPAAGA